jgi:hypothetical protein
MPNEPTRNAAPIRGFRWWWNELRFRWKWRRHPEVVATINPHPAPSAAVERLRQRVLSGDWTDDV